MNRIVLLSVVLVLSGCLVSSTSHERVTGNYVADNTFDQIKPGKTTAGWVKATLGEPSIKTEVKEAGTEVWKYEYTEHRDGSGAIFLIFGGTSSKEKPHTAFVEIKDGVVTNKWRG